MAKVGKKQPPVDPFKVGGKAFKGIDDALSGLDGAEDGAAAEPERESAVESRPAAAPQAETAEQPRRSAPATRPPPAKPRPAPAPSAEETQDSGGGGEGRALGAHLGPKKAKRFLATMDELRRFDRAAVRLSAQLGIKVDFSKLSRALWEVYLRNEDDILRNVPEDETWEMPPTADQLGQAKLEEKLVGVLNTGLLAASHRPRSARGRKG